MKGRGKGAKGAAGDAAATRKALDNERERKSDLQLHPHVKTLKFHFDNDLGRRHLWTLVDYCERNPFLRVSFHSDWSLANDNAIMALAKLVQVLSQQETHNRKMYGIKHRLVFRHDVLRLPQVLNNQARDAYSYTSMHSINFRHNVLRLRQVLKGKERSKCLRMDTSIHM